MSLSQYKPCTQTLIKTDTANEHISSLEPVSECVCVCACVRVYVCVCVCARARARACVIYIHTCVSVCRRETGEEEKRERVVFMLFFKFLFLSCFVFCCFLLLS